MLTKINRKNCLEKYKIFPQRNDYREKYFYPETFSYDIITINSKSARGHAKAIAIEFTKLIKDIGFESLIFLGDIKIPWRYQFNDYKRVIEALQFLNDNKVDEKFNGALQIDLLLLPTFVKHLFWLTRCNASLPYFYFIDEGENIMGHLCKYGNFHINTLNEHTYLLLEDKLSQSKFSFLDINNCYNQFSIRSAISGRKIII